MTTFAIITALMGLAILALCIFTHNLAKRLEDLEAQVEMLKIEQDLTRRQMG